MQALTPTGGQVALNNPLTTCVVAGSRITIVRSFIGFSPCGQAQPGAPSAVVRKDSPLEPARVARKHPRVERWPQDHSPQASEPVAERAAS